MCVSPEHRGQAASPRQGRPPLPESTALHHQDFGGGAPHPQSQGLHIHGRHEKTLSFMEDPGLQDLWDLSQTLADVIPECQDQDVSSTCTSWAWLGSPASHSLLVFETRLLSANLHSSSCSLKRGSDLLCLYPLSQTATGICGDSIRFHSLSQAQTAMAPGQQDMHSKHLD